MTQPLEIVQIGHPALRRAVAPMPLSALASDHAQATIDAMLLTMEHSTIPCDGLAANQIDRDLRCFIARAPSHLKGGPVAPGAILVVCNPVITIQDATLMDGWEGCLSILGMRGLVKRHRALRLQGLDRHGQPIDLVLEGYLARIVQHELDHLDGVLYFDRIYERAGTDPPMIVTSENLHRFHRPRRERSSPARVAGSVSSTATSHQPLRQ